MFQALFNSLSGLFSFSRSLNTISNNVSNMNTPGFHGSDVFLTNIANGRGVSVTGEVLRTQAGDQRQTTADTDVAINGEGYFILRDDAGNLHYTRAGQFRFNNDGVLEDYTTKYKVMAFNSAGVLDTIDRNNYLTLPAQATTGVHIQGNILPSSTPSQPVTVSNILVYDASGATHKLTVTITAIAPTTGTNPTGRFNVAITNEAGNAIGQGEIAFDLNTNLLSSTSATTINAVLPVSGGNQTIAFNFGTAGVPTGLTMFSGNGTSVGSRIDNGHGVLGITEAHFDSSGILQFTYSSTETRAGPQLALARFPSQDLLHLDADRMVSGASVANATFGRPASAGFGDIKGRSLEMSNVDLTQEFADMIIVQRGYQASSRVMTVSNEMLEQLYNSTRGG